MRHHISIKLKITLWFTILMLALAGISLGFVAMSGDYVMEDNVKNTLMKTVDGNAKEIDYEHGRVEIDDDFDYYVNGVMCSVYDLNERLISGQIPSSLRFSEVKFENWLVRAINAGGDAYFIYDRRVDVGGEAAVWVRGVAAATGGGSIVGIVGRLLFFILPFLVLIAAVGGYLIAKRAFSPVDKIIKSVNAINGGNDLSKRLGLSDTGDEIHHLAATFDKMFGRLEKSFNAEKQFTSDASHELRTPVAVILGQCEYLEKKPCSQEEYMDGIEVIKRQADKMSCLISRLLGITRIEQGTAKAVLERADVSELVEVVCREYFADKERITLHTDITPGIFADVDISLFSRMLENLLENAYKYRRKDGGNVSVTLRSLDGSAILSVKDDGVGISVEDHEKVWRRFYQADQSRGADSGLGLGLPMVKQIAELHGGSVSLSSELGKGSVFTITFPSQLSTTV